jgi:hypothetical protein
MQNYNIYKNSVGIYEAVKGGWSWPGFFFTWIWCFVKKINSIGVGLLIYYMITWFIPIGEMDILLFFISLGINIWLGSSGNKMRKTNLIKRGFQFQGSVISSNPDAAISEFANKGRSEDVNDDAIAVNPTIVDDQEEGDTVIGTSSIYLEFLNGSLSGQRIMVFKDTTIGRSSENDIALSEKTISASHCRIKVVNDEFVIEDLNSTNGTFIDGQKISKQNIAQGNELQLSSIKIKVH